MGEADHGSYQTALQTKSIRRISLVICLSMTVFFHSENELEELDVISEENDVIINKQRKRQNRIGLSYSSLSKHPRRVIYAGKAPSHPPAGQLRSPAAASPKSIPSIP